MLGFFFESLTAILANYLVTTWVENTVSWPIHTNATNSFIYSFNVQHLNNMLFLVKVPCFILKFNGCILLSFRLLGFLYYLLQFLLVSLFLNIRMYSAIFNNSSAFLFLFNPYSQCARIYSHQKQH